ncbi:hypothetical protein [Pseudactinotalea terrae]|uniref:hypothetical protein n=1 Tax=Pseudactinotalea terrae TaxID=1743262 RepID=UPI0012E2920B|nr:hypothetical protein [Pseudactinotalea terrae]
MAEPHRQGVTQNPPLLLGLLGPTGQSERRVVDTLVSTHGFRDYDLGAPARAALETLDPMLSSDRSLAELVATAGWDGAAAHRIHGPEVTRLLEQMRFTLPGSLLPASVWVAAVQASVAAGASMLGSAPVVVHDVRSPGEVAWLLEQGGALWQASGRPRPDAECVLSTGVSDVALGRRVARELATVQSRRRLVSVGTREEA